MKTDSLFKCTFVLLDLFPREFLEFRVNIHDLVFKFHFLTVIQGVVDFLSPDQDGTQFSIAHGYFSFFSIPRNRARIYTWGFLRDDFFLVFRADTNRTRWLQNGARDAGLYFKIASRLWYVLFKKYRWRMRAKFEFYVCVGFLSVMILAGNVCVVLCEF